MQHMTEIRATLGGFETCAALKVDSGSPVLWVIICHLPDNIFSFPLLKVTFIAHFLRYLVFTVAQF